MKRASAAAPKAELFAPKEVESVLPELERARRAGLHQQRVALSLHFGAGMTCPALQKRADRAACRNRHLDGLFS